MNTFFAEIIKALPNAIATAVVTVLLSGVILFLFQKKIEDYFARRLIKYSSDLQKELAQDQLRFSRNYPKTLDILKALYEKFTIFADTFSESLVAKNDFKAKREYASAKLKDFE